MTTQRNLYPAIGIPETTYSDGWERDDPFTIATFDSGDCCCPNLRRLPNGDTWSVPRPSCFRSPCSPLSMKRIPGRGHLLALWNDHSRVHGHRSTDWQSSSWGRTPLSLAVSMDDGKTWGAATDVETDPNRGFCYTAIHFTEDDVLLAYCCGGGRTKSLQDLCIRRMTLKDLKF